MAKIVLGIGSSHGPQLHLPPDQWWRRVESDKRNPELWFRGRTYAFDDLVRERSSEPLEQELAPERWQERFDRCQGRIAGLAETVARVAPDVAVVLGDDQKESFLDDNMPAISVYWGEKAETPKPVTDETDRERAWLGVAWQRPHVVTPCEPELGLHIIQSLVQEEFDVAHSRSLPAGRRGDHSIGHAFGYVYDRLMNQQPIPNVPIFLNTYYPPNQPTLKRCYRLGQALRRAIKAWDSDKTVALIASGGLTHFVIDEEIDRPLLEAMAEKDEKGMTDWPLDLFNSGTSEIRNWIVVAGAMEESDLQMNVIDYVPCYRSEAGTGCAMAFAEWV